MVVSASPSIAAPAVVTVGVSAGAVEALSTLLPSLKVGVPFAVVVVAHVPPQKTSLLPVIFAGKCALPVSEIEDKMPISPGTLYFAPPDYHVLFEGTEAFALSTDEAVNYSRPSIDVTFESAADAFKTKAVGVLLTGANADGAHGLLAIQKAGGKTVVQEPATAFSREMPMAALQLMHPDVVLPVGEIAAWVQALGSQ